MVDYAALPFKPDGCRFEFRGDGSVLITPGYDLPTLWPSIPHLFVDRARRFPDRPFVARRERLADGSRGDWRRLTYGQALTSATALTHAMPGRKYGLDRRRTVCEGGDPRLWVVNI